MHPRRHVLSRSLDCRMGTTIGSVLIALALPLMLVAAPPEAKNAKTDEVPFFPLLPDLKAERLATLSWTAPLTPQTGNWSVLADLYAGTHPKVQAWDLRGLFSTKAGRINYGASLLVLTGFGAPADTPLMELVMLQAAEVRDCWGLINTDEVRPFPKAFLKVIHDRRDFRNGDLEYEAYWQTLVLAHYTSARAFARSARRDLTYANLFNEPPVYRGHVVHVTGRLIRRPDRLTPMDEARAAGVEHLYEAWIMTDQYGQNPLCCVFSDPPSGLKMDASGAFPKRKYNDPVSFDGYFYKRYRYKAGDSKKVNEYRDAPLVIGHTLIGRWDEAAAEPEGETWGSDLIWVFLGVIACTVLAVIGLTCWFRLHDRRIRQRLRASRAREFVPPTEAPLRPESEPATNGNGAVGESPPRQPALDYERGTSWSDYPQSPN
jgi:hypothetical protein